MTLSFVQVFSVDRIRQMEPKCGLPILVRDHKGIVVSVDVDAGATVKDLKIAAQTSGVALHGRTLTFRGDKLLDPSALLSDLGVSAGAEVGVSDLLSAIFWSRNALDSLNPIFEAEIRIDSGKDQGQIKTVHIQWSSVSSQQFEDTPFEDSFFWIDVIPIQMTVMCQNSEGKWVRYPEGMCAVEEQRNVFGYLEKEHINIIRSGSNGEKYISVDMTKHVYEKYGQRLIDDLSYAELEGVVHPGMDNVKWSVTLKSVVEPQEVTLEKFMSTQKPFTLKQILRRLGMMHFEQVLATNGYEIETLFDVLPGQLTAFGIAEQQARDLIACCRGEMPWMKVASHNVAPTSIVLPIHREPNNGVSSTKVWRSLRSTELPKARSPLESAQLEEGEAQKPDYYQYSPTLDVSSSASWVDAPSAHGEPFPGHVCGCLGISDCVIMGIAALGFYLFIRLALIVV